MDCGPTAKVLAFAWLYTRDHPERSSPLLDPHGDEKTAISEFELYQFQVVFCPTSSDRTTETSREDRAHRSNHSSSKHSEAVGSLSQNNSPLDLADHKF